MKRLIRMDEVPTGGIRAMDNGKLFKASSLSNLQKQIAEYRKANNLPVGAHFDEQVMDAVCQELEKNGNSDQCVEAGANIPRGLVGLLKAGLGVGIADVQTLLKRQEICLSCDHARTSNGVFERCEICKCRSAKLRLKTEKCPIGKW